MYFGIVKKYLCNIKKNIKSSKTFDCWNNINCSTPDKAIKCIFLQLLYFDLNLVPNALLLFIPNLYDDTWGFFKSFFPWFAWIIFSMGWINKYEVVPFE